MDRRDRNVLVADAVRDQMVAEPENQLISCFQTAQAPSDLPANYICEYDKANAIAESENASADEIAAAKKVFDHIVYQTAIGPNIDNRDMSRSHGR